MGFSESSDSCVMRGVEELYTGQKSRLEASTAEISASFEWHGKFQQPTEAQATVRKMSCHHF